MDSYNADARLMADFEQSCNLGESFDYLSSIKHAQEPVPEEEIAVYLSKMQRGGLIQPHGCLLAIEKGSFKIIGYSNNCFDFLGLNHLCETSVSTGLIGFDARTLFIPSSAKSLEKAIDCADLSMVNPIWVHSRSTHKPFYAILNRIDVGNIIELEPSESSNPSLLVADAVRSQKLVVRTISELQSLPGGDINLLCNTVTEEVRKLTGYDRVMVYKFHEDQHGEVVSESKRPDLEPYLGLHYPATDIPQAARFLFKQNRVRMICNCHSDPIRVVQSKERNQPLYLVNSTLRAPHSCHYSYMANMGSIASLVMAVIVNENDSTKLWGLVSCHHTSPRYIHYPLRYACGFLMQVFGKQLDMEIQLAKQSEEKNILRMQTILCDLLLQDIPFGIITQSPTIMDLVKCDGAALCYEDKCWLLRVTPTESQIGDISKWLLENHGDSKGFSTGCLIDTGYPGANLLADKVCGMVAARISTKGFLFWFRSHTAKEIKWGGCAKPPENGIMHPRTSFQALLEVVKSRSLPWEASEINVIHTLQVIIGDKLLDTQGCGNMATENHYPGKELNELNLLVNQMAKLIETASAPIFGVNSDGLINGWNSKTAKLTGLKKTEAIGKSLVNDIVLDDSREIAEDIVSKALQGEEEQHEVELKLKRFNSLNENSNVCVLASACSSKDCSSNVVGVSFLGQDITCEKVLRGRFISLQGDYEAIVHSLNPLVPPIFASTENASCSEWNMAMEKLSGWARHEVIGKLLPGEIFGGLCRLKGEDMLTKFTSLLYHVVNGQVGENLQFGFFNKEEKYVEVVLMASERTNGFGKSIGCLLFVEASDRKQEIKVDIMKDTELSYIRQEIRRPLNGIQFIHQLLKSTIVAENQRQLLETSVACQRQMLSVLDNMDFNSIKESRIELNSEEFLLVYVIDAVVSQVMIPFDEKNIQLVHEIPDKVKTLSVLGDQVKLQLVLSAFLHSIARHTPPNTWVEINLSHDLKTSGDDLVDIQIRMTHPGEGFPSGLLQELSEETNLNRRITEEGLGLNMSCKLLKLMNGNITYMRESDKCYFLINLKLGLSAQCELTGMDESSERVT